MPQYLVTVAPRESSAAEPAVQSLYLLAGSTLADAAVAQLAAELLHDPVTQHARWCALTEADLAAEARAAIGAAGRGVLEIAYRPGVTDNEAESALEGSRRLGVAGVERVRALRRCLLPAGADVRAAARELANDLVQTTLVYHDRDAVANAERRRFYADLLTPPADVMPHTARVPLRDADDTTLLEISRAGVLALDLAEMHAIRDYFAALGRDPTDGELETLAQTWSEHCSHKTFKARVRYRVQPSAEREPPADLDADRYAAYHMLRQDCEINSLIRTFLMSATSDILAARSASDWVLSAFVDNAGIVAFTDDYEVSFKVETHNHPSALEPFGGANTGVGGVIRDVLGVSALPIANTDVLCFGPPDLDAAGLSDGVLHPRRICAGVVAGVRDYGNKMGIPTVNGAVLFDPGYTANPLVYCGTLGIAPRGAHPRDPQPGDAIVVAGGRTGRDGIHGATFSSVELTHSTAAEVGSAVQIGDPITEKKVLDVIIQARDLRLYNAITDCGAGGLSSAVGEMGAGIGATVELESVPLKYAGLQPWEIWLSEAQERMVLAVPQDDLAAFLDLCAAEDVEATAIGRFTDDKMLRITHAGQTVVEIGMNFLHDGLPQRLLDALWDPSGPARAAAEPSSIPSGEPLALLLALLAHPNIASKERIVRTYDHEVGGATVIKPLVGAASDGPGDATALQPLCHSNRGLALGCGINPNYGKIDPYWMALACVDEALRNVVATGGDPARATILDNFCWGDPRQPDRMAGLTRAAAGCYDAARAFGTPFISGKDSLNNEYRDATGVRVAIPPTLLISALAEVPDVDQTVTMDLKAAGNVVYLVGATRDELAGSHLELVMGATLPSALPKVDLTIAPKTFAALHSAIRAGLVQACHDLSEGGLSVAAAEMAFAGGIGLMLNLGALRVSDGSGGTLVQLFAETPSRFLVEVRPADAAAFEATLAGVALAQIGATHAEAELRVIDDTGTEILRADLATLKAAWQGGLESIDL